MSNADRNRSELCLWLAKGSQTLLMAMVAVAQFVQVIQSLSN